MTFSVANTITESSGSSSAAPRSIAASVQPGTLHLTQAVAAYTHDNLTPAEQQALPNEGHILAALE
jgi:hypothetical protein